MSGRKKGQQRRKPGAGKGQAGHPARKPRQAAGGAPPGAAAQQSDPAARPPGNPARPATARTPAAAPAAPEHVLPRIGRPVAATVVAPDAATAPAQASSAEEAFDRLYTRTAAALLRQAEVLTGDPATARRAVAHAFDQAWQRWPEVARDSNPVGWLRTTTYDHALTPWHRRLPLHPTPGSPHRVATTRPSSADAAHGSPTTADPAGGSGATAAQGSDVTPDAAGAEALAVLAAALLELPPAYRRALVLHDGLGLGVVEAAVESEATTGAMAGRIVHAREELAATAPAVAGGEGGGLSVRLGALLDAGPGAEPPDRPAGVRDASERGVRRRTVGVYALTGLIAVLTLVMVLVGPGGRPHAARQGAGPGSAGGTGEEAAPGPLRPDGTAGRPPFGEPARDLLP